MNTTKRATFKVLFYLKKNAPKKDGSVPIMGRITINGKITQFSTKITINSSKWDITHNRIVGKSKEATQINQKLDTIRVRINACYNKILEQDGFVTPQKVKNMFFGIDTKKDTLLTLYKSYLDDFYKKVDKTKVRGSWLKFNTAYKHAKNFIKYQFKTDDIPLRELKEEFINDFENYLIDVKNLKTNTIAGYIKTLKRVVRLAVSKGLLNKNPFVNHATKTEKTNRAFLTEEELEKFGAIQLDSKQEEFIRDIFVFCCFTGLSYIDVKNLKFDEIERFWDKSLWIIKKREKTKTNFSVKLLATPLRIIEKYKGIAKDDYVFDIPSNATCRAYLKSITKKAGIKKHVTFHVSRHTCATLFLSNNVPIESVSKMLGHSDIRTTQIYARITNKKISEDMEKLAFQLQNVENQLATGL